VEQGDTGAFRECELDRAVEELRLKLAFQWT
jgi:hypothetical protein